MLAAQLRTQRSPGNMRTKYEQYCVLYLKDHTSTRQIAVAHGNMCCHCWWLKAKHDVMKVLLSEPVIQCAAQEHSFCCFEPDKGGSHPPYAGRLSGETPTDVTATIHLPRNRSRTDSSATS